MVLVCFSFKFTGTGNNKKKINTNHTCIKPTSAAIKYKTILKSSLYSTIKKTNKSKGHPS